MLFSRKMFLLLLKIYKGESIFKCLQKIDINILEETIGIIIYQKLGSYSKCRISYIVDSIILF